MVTQKIAININLITKLNPFLLAIIIEGRVMLNIRKPANPVDKTSLPVQILGMVLLDCAKPPLSKSNTMEPTEGKE